MKSLTTKITIATAFLAAAAGVASAQTMKAEVPFAFHAGNKVMPPGTYIVRITGGERGLIALSNFDARQSAMLAAGPLTDPAKEWRKAGAPVLSFECGANRCALDEVWMGPAFSAQTIRHPRVTSGEPVALKLVRLEKVNGE